MKRNTRLICMMLSIGMLFALAACGNAPESAETSRAAPESGAEEEYIITRAAPLPEAITTISGGILSGEKLLACCWEEADEAAGEYYIAAIDLAGDGFEKWPLTQAATRIPIDIAPDGQGGAWCAYADESAADSTGVKYALCRLDVGGAQVAEIPLNTLMERYDAYQYAGRRLFLNADGAGRLCLTVKNAKTSCLIFDAEGEFLFALEDDVNPMTAITLNDGRAAVCATRDGGEEYVLLPIDMERRAWGAEEALGAVINAFDGGGDTDYYLYRGADLCACGLGGTAADALFAWAELGLSSGDTHTFPMPGGGFAVVTGRFSQTGLMAYELCIVAPGHDDRTPLTLLSLSPDDSIREAVALFNKNNRDYKIALTAYALQYQDAGADEWRKAVSRLNTELIAGKLPDLIDLNGLPAEEYMRRGLLEDLYPYIQNDPQLDVEDYYSNVFDALSIDGKFPYVTSSVQVFTMLANAEAVGMRRGWTYDEFMRERQSGQIIVEWYAPEEYLELLLASSGRFIDWDSGECRFEGEEFAQLLTLCKGMDDGEAVNILFPEESEANCVYAPLLSTMFAAQYNARFAGNTTPIGFPSAPGEQMHILDTANRIGITTACAHKDGAWSFARSFLEAPMQEGGIFFPYLKSSFEKLAYAAAEGNTIWRGGIYNGGVHEADIAFARNVLANANCCMSGETELTDMIIELAKAYFAGDRSAEAVCADIQRRAEIYAAEHR